MELFDQPNFVAFVSIIQESFRTFYFISKRILINGNPFIAEKATHV